MVREVKEPAEKIQLVDNTNKDIEFVNYKDFVHEFLKEKKVNEEINKQILWAMVLPADGLKKDFKII